MSSSSDFEERESSGVSAKKYIKFYSKRVKEDAAKRNVPCPALSSTEMRALSTEERYRMIERFYEAVYAEDAERGLAETTTTTTTTTKDGSFSHEERLRELRSLPDEEINRLAEDFFVGLVDDADDVTAGTTSDGTRADVVRGIDVVRLDDDNVDDTDMDEPRRKGCQVIWTACPWLTYRRSLVLLIIVFLLVIVGLIVAYYTLS